VQLAEVDVFILTVPTPIDSAKRPDLTPLEKASATVGRALKARAAQGATTTPMVIYESTVYPGATEEVCVPILERESGLRFNTDFFCGYSPERINSGDTEHKLTTIIKVTRDGCSIHSHKEPERLPAWRAAIAHVPQMIYLADRSIAENIAFGVAAADLDLERVKLAAQQAQIAEFIQSSPRGYKTNVGERGIRLSGGQRQRIGIARALYKQASVLVFDEATSALDNATEAALMKAIEGLLSRELTIVMIAHRLSTVARCDRVIELEGGIIKTQGTAQQLLDVRA